MTEYIPHLPRLEVAQKMSLRGQAPMYNAACDCGWRSSAVESKNQAARSANQHAAQARPVERCGQRAPDSTGWGHYTCSLGKGHKSEHAGYASHDINGAPSVAWEDFERVSEDEVIEAIESIKEATHGRQA